MDIEAYKETHEQRTHIGALLYYSKRIQRLRFVSLNKLSIDVTDIIFCNMQFFL